MGCIGNETVSGLPGATMRLRGFLAAGYSYENRGGNHDPLDDDIEIALDMLQWANHPEEAKEQETPRWRNLAAHDISVEFEATQGEGPLEDDLRFVGAALRRAGFEQPLS